MFIFIIAVRSEKVSKSWENVSQLFEKTLQSVCNQSRSDFKVIVVCHERPVINFRHQNIKYIDVEFPPPVLTGNSSEDILSKEVDKRKKFWIALKYSASFNPSHIMFVDADDRVSSKIVSYVENHIHDNGWYVDQGFELPENKSVIYPKSNFYEKCGTSNIVRYDLIKKISKIDSMKIEVCNEFSYLHHRHIHKYCNDLGYPLKPLPFPGAIYITGHGDNIFLEYFSKKQKTLLDFLRLYGGKLKKMFIAKSITRQIQNEFYL